MADGHQPEDVIISTGLDVTYVDEGELIVLSFRSRGRGPVRISLPRLVASGLAKFVQQKLAQVDTLEAMAQGEPGTSN